VTFAAGSCKSLSHELAQGTTPRRARLSSRQSERGAAAGRTRADRGVRARRGSTFADAARSAGVQPRGALPAFSRSRRAAFEHRATRLRAVRGSAEPGLGRCAVRHTVPTAFERVGQAYLAFARAEPAVLFGDVRNQGSVDLNPALLAASEARFRHHPGRRRAFRAALAPPACRAPPALMMALHICRCRTAWRRCSLVASGAPPAADVGGRPAGSGGVDLSARSTASRPTVDARPKRQADQKPPGPPPVPPSGPWGTHK